MFQVPNSVSSIGGLWIFSGMAHLTLENSNEIKDFLSPERSHDHTPIKSKECQPMVITKQTNWRLSNKNSTDIMLGDITRFLLESDSSVLFGYFRPFATNYKYAR